MMKTYTIGEKAAILSLEGCWVAMAWCGILLSIYLLFSPIIPWLMYATQMTWVFLIGSSSPFVVIMIDAIRRTNNKHGLFAW